MHFAEAIVKYKRARNNLVDDGPADVGAFKLVLRLQPLKWLEQPGGVADALHDMSARPHHATHFDARVLATPRTCDALPNRLPIRLGQQAGIAGCRKWRGDIEIGALLRGSPRRGTRSLKPLIAAGGACRPFEIALELCRSNERCCIKRMR